MVALVAFSRSGRAADGLLGLPDGGVDFLERREGLRADDN
jgi:hypothetical protein